MMNVAHVVQSIGLGGVTSVIKGISDNLPNTQKPFIFVLKSKAQQASINELRVKIFDGKNGFSPRSFFFLVSEIKKNNIDVIHVHSMIKTVLVVILVRTFYKTNVRIILHEHGVIMGSEKGSKLSEFIYCFLLKFFGYSYDKIIAVANIAKERLIEYANVPSDKITVLYNFYEDQRFDLEKYTEENVASWRNSHGFTHKDFIVGFAGRLVKIKGVYEFIESVEQVKNLGYLNIRFVIAGDGIERIHILKQISDKKLDDYVKYIGLETNMPLFYKSINIFAMPSYWETFSMAAIEAQAMGVPLIASQSGGLTEAILNEKTGLFIKPKDASSLTNAILKLHGNKKLRDEIIKNSIGSAKKFNIELYLKSLNKIYDELYN